MRSAGVMMSVRRIPNLSFTTTTSPWAIRQPLTSTSIGSPAMPSSSTTEPCASCSRLRMAILVRPSSTVIWTGMSRIMSMSLRVEVGSTFDSGWNTPAVVAVTSGLSFCSASALAQSAIASSSSVLTAPAASCGSPASASASGFAFRSLISTILHRVGCADHFLDPQRVLTIENSVAALHHRHAVDFRGDVLGDVDRQNIAFAHVQDLFERDRHLREVGGQFHFRSLHL